MSFGPFRVGAKERNYFIDNILKHKIKFGYCCLDVLLLYNLILKVKLYQLVSLRYKKFLSNLIKKNNMFTKYYQRHFYL